MSRILGDYTESRVKYGTTGLPSTPFWNRLIMSNSDGMIRVVAGATVN